PPRRPGGGALLGFLAQAGDAFAADILDEAVEIIAAVIVGDLLLGLDVAQRPDLDHVPDEVDLGVRPAGMIDVAGEVAAARSVDGPAVVELEQVLVVELVGLVVRKLASAVAGDVAALLDRPAGEHAKPGKRAADPNVTS